MSDQQAVEEQPEPIGYVYFIREVMKNGKGRIKIGYSLHSPDDRFIAHNLSSPRDLEKLALMRATYSHEQALHKRFKKLWKRGEWFRSHPSLLAYIAENARDWMELLREEKGIIEAEREDKEREEQARKLEEERVREEEQQIWNKFYMGCLRRGYTHEEIRQMTPGKLPPPRARNFRTHRYSPLQALLDKLAADEGPTP